jgi:ATP-dependent Clp protease ATP-binding subunit ClpC
LQILGDGRLTDPFGRVADFCNSVIVMTSNLGAEARRKGRAGFRSEDTAPDEAQEHFTEAVRKFLRPEIFNRLDAIVPFRALTRDIILSIARKHVEMIQQRDGIRLRPVSWQIDPEVVPYLAERGYDAKYGARPLKRTIERELLAPLADALNAYQRNTTLAAKIGMAEGKLQIHLRATKEEQKPGGGTATTEDEWHAALAAGTAPAGHNPEEWLANRIVAERRLIGRLQRSRAASRIDDEVTVLESLERRMARMKWKNVQIQARLAKLPKLRDAVKAITTLAERAQHLETEALGSFYQRESLETALLAPELQTLETERYALMRRLFRLQQEEPDDIVIAFYSEDRDMLFEFAAAYYTVAGDLGKVVSLDYFIPPPSARSKATKLLRETPKKIEQFFPSPPEKVVGIVIHAQGDLFFARFHGEAGLHKLKGKKKDRICLIQTAPLPFEKYEPPDGIDRPGTIEALNAPTCRKFDQEKDTLTDSILGERPWGKTDLRWVIRQLTEDRLKHLIESVTL